MKKFMDDDFLLYGESAKELYHNCAEKLPIIDYHCHLSPKEIAENKRFSNITELWLYGDHYKWRAMRQCGTDEKYITGKSSDYDKFREYCRIMPYLAGNPLYHWSHLELKRYFDCDLTICPENCEEIWKITSKRLQDEDMSAKELIKKSRVTLLCTTDDPRDSLEHHKAIADSGYSVKVLPAFRPDKGLNIDKPGFAEYIQSLGLAANTEIKDYDSLCEAYMRCLDRFENMGCRTADHGMDNYISFSKPDKFHADIILKKALKKETVTDEEISVWKTQMMRFFGQEYVKRGWVMQLHYGVLRNPNKTMYSKLGADTGFDMIYGQSCISDMARLLNYLTEWDALPRTVIYPINPSDNAPVAALCGSFCKGDGSGMPTVLQGSAWWFNDNIKGMEEQMLNTANLSSFGNFLGMLTDSRSFISYPRHEYFRRILCNLVGDWIEKGQIPDNINTAKDLIKRISYEHGIQYFGFEV